MILRTAILILWVALPLVVGAGVVAYSLLLSLRTRPETTPSRGAATGPPVIRRTTSPPAGPRT